uniref:Uncharacterized protein n=1 Tax=Acrobeloides nanus TaxID=290746 RepID=A0A914DFD7_9BILA
MSRQPQITDFRWLSHQFGSSSDRLHDESHLNCTGQAEVDLESSILEFQVSIRNRHWFGPLDNLDFMAKRKLLYQLENLASINHLDSW